MARITILGAGITGLSIANELSETHDVTIVARDLPGDAPTQAWASLWACAGWAALGGTESEQKMQLTSLSEFLKIAESSPESSVKRTSVTDLHDFGADDARSLWYYDRVPGFENCNLSTLPKGQETKLATKYTGFVLDPEVFLPWFRKHLETKGVKFERISTVASLDELKRLNHDVLVNASGAASRTLTDVLDGKIITDRTYVTVIKSDFKDILIRRSEGEYVYIFGRQDGTAVLGGISVSPDEERKSVEETRNHLIKRANSNLPAHFPWTDPADYTFVKDLEGLRPLRLPEVRVEKEIMNEQKVVHAYGTTAGGYIFAFGLAQEAARLVRQWTVAV